MIGFEPTTFCKARNGRLIEVVAAERGTPALIVGRQPVRAAFGSAGD
jgi:hypothetical protein